jgi:hypothetical protein
MRSVVSLVAVAFGIFVIISPARAAKIWGWKNLDQLTPLGRSWYFRAYRMWGVLLCAAGIFLEASRT